MGLRVYSRHPVTAMMIAPSLPPAFGRDEVKPVGGYFRAVRASIVRVNRGYSGVIRSGVRQVKRGAEIACTARTVEHPVCFGSQRPD